MPKPQRKEDVLIPRLKAGVSERHSYMNYGVLRVVGMRDLANARAHLQECYPGRWLHEEHLVHLLTRHETTIGRALSNDIILMDPTVSREHARLVLDEYGWHVVNLTLQNSVRVNGHPLPSGSHMTMQPLDVLVLGSTILQLIAPQTADASDAPTDLAKPRLPFSPVTVPWANLPATNGQTRADTPPDEQRPPSQNTASLEAHSWYTCATPAHNTISSLPVQPELVTCSWENEEAGGMLGAGITMQFALPQRMGIQTRWLIAGVGITILTVSAVITVIINSLLGISALTRNGPSSVLAAFIIPLIPALGINLLVNFIDRFQREPWFLRLAAFLWGALIAIPPAFLIEVNVNGAIQSILGPDVGNLVRSAFQGLNAGVTEETVKGLGLLLLFFALRDEFDNVTDGIVYGALIGAGFAMVENFVYFASNSKDFLLFLIVGRVVLGWLSHSTFTMCFGAALGYIRHTRVRWKQIVIPLMGYLVAIGLHSIFDFIDFYANATVLAAPSNANAVLFSLIAIVGNYIPPFIAQMMLVYFLIKALAHEAAVIREFLASEVSTGVVKVDEYALLQNSFERAKQERRVLWHSGIKQWLRVKALYQTEISLAFHKWHVSMGDRPKRGYRQPEGTYRQRIRHLHQEIAATQCDP